MLDIKTKILKLLDCNDYQAIKPENQLTLDDFFNKKIILYGAGGGFHTFNNWVVKKYNLNVIAVIDKKFQYETKYAGYKCYGLNNFPSNLIDNETIVIITVTRPEFEAEIFQYVKKLGFNKIIKAKDLYEFNLPVVPNDLLEKGQKYYIDNKGEILTAAELFVDDISKEIYYKFIKTHFLKTPQRLPLRESSEQYFPQDIKLNKGHKRLIHCGAYIGDTIKDMMNRAGKIESLACFEPDPENFKELSKFVNTNKSDIAELILLFPCAVSNSEGVVKFRSAGAESMISINSTSDYHIHTVALDNVLIGFRPTFITMDIEGYELEALKGARMILEQYKPDLAICVYHMPKDIWEIPLYLNRLNLGYNFFLRNYRGFCVETILYATVDG